MEKYNLSVRLFQPVRNIPINGLKMGMFMSRMERGAAKTGALNRTTPRQQSGPSPRAVSFV